MTDQQTAATDNALIEKLEATRPEAIWRDVITQVLINPDGPEAAERIKSLLAEKDDLRTAYLATAEAAATHLKGKLAAEADRQRMRDALEAVNRIWGKIVPKAEAEAVGELMAAALNPASKEANDG